MSSFKEFSAHVMKHGLARTNRYQVLIPLPQKMLQAAADQTPEGSNSKLKQIFGEVVKVIKVFTGGGTTEFTRGLDLMCTQTELPGKILNTAEAKYNGDIQKSGHSIMYGVQQFSFKVSTDMHEKTIMDKWMNLIVDPITHEVGYPDDYSVDITVFQLDNMDKVVHAIILRDAFPAMVNPLVLSNLETNNTHELMAQFTYRRWENLELTVDESDRTSSLMQTPLGPYLAPILSNPVVQRGLEYFENATGIDLEGEAVNIYNQVDEVIRSTTGESINSTVGLLNSMKVSIEQNDKITPKNAADLLDLVEGTINRFK